MSDAPPYAPLRFNHDLVYCECGCGKRLLVIDDEPIFSDEPEHLRPCMIPTPEVIVAAMRRIVEEARNAENGRPVSRDVAMLSMLLDGYLGTLEVLTRLSMHGVEGTGDPDADEDGLDRALDAAHDYVLAASFLHLRPDVAPQAIEIDLANVAVNLGIDREREGEDDDNTPTPTDFEA